MDVKKEIINYIRRNRVSTTEIADCLGKSGCLEDIHPLTAGMFCAGEVFYTYAVNESNWTIHEDLRAELEDKIVYMDAIDTNGRAMVGELVSKYVLLYQRASAIVTNGKMRDAHRLIKEKYPIWCSGVTPVGTFNLETDTSKFSAIINENRSRYENSILVCDDSGIVLIPKEKINSDFLEKIVKIEEQEDIWFECLDRRKWNTYDIVCMKKYRDT